MRNGNYSLRKDVEATTHIRQFSTFFQKIAIVKECLHSHGNFTRWKLMFDF